MKQRIESEPRDTTLSRADALLWQVWQRATESVMTRVAHDIAEETGLSGADYRVLSQLIELSHSALRQQELADAMGWHKSRLSHQLSRMEPRDLVRRNQAKANSVLVAITPNGRRALHAALGVHARAVKRHLAVKVPRAERRRWLEILTELGNTTRRDVRAMS